MLIFMLITFGLFWFVIKSNVLYVVRTGNVDGGGLFFPSAINQTFTGLYFMEICLIGLFFLVRDERGHVACEAQGIIMAAALIVTILYQWWLYSTFHPLYTYLPVTAEGYVHQQDRNAELEHLRAIEKGADDESSGEHGRERYSSEGSTRDSTEKAFFPSPGSERQLIQQDHAAAAAAAAPIESARPSTPQTSSQPSPKATPTKPEPTEQRQSTAASPTAGELRSIPRASSMQAQQERDQASSKQILARFSLPRSERTGHLTQLEHALGHTLIPRQADVERQLVNDPISRIIMRHNDDLEDLDPRERDQLVSAAFTHPVLRQVRPAVWIPQDELGVSDDEVRRTRALSKDVFIENRGAFFNRRLKVEVDMQPPDMSEFALLVNEL